MISAKLAKEIAVKADQDSKNAWLQLEKRIDEAAKKGKTSIIFKTHPGMEFIENRKEVAAKLRLLGYEVSYRKYDEDCGYITGNIYNISWF